MHKMDVETLAENKYIFKSTFASFILPVILMLLVALLGFGPPESDSAEIQGFVFTIMLFPLIFLFQLLAYWVLGKNQIKRVTPSLALGSIVGAMLSLPLTILVLSISITTGATVWEAVFGAIIFIFLPLWLSFTIGSFVQYISMVRNA